MDSNSPLDAPTETPETEKKKSTQDRRQDAGLCRRCGKCPPVEGVKVCQVCREKYNKLSIEYAKKAKEKAEKEGVVTCTRCRCRPPLEGRKQCGLCFEEGRKKRDKRMVSPTCSRCKKPKEPGKSYCPDCQRYYNDQNIDRNKAVKDEVFAHYGGYVCVCCGETEPSVMQLDHCDNNGAEHRRREEISGGPMMYRWIKDNGFPDGFQPLCALCNWSKHQNSGKCHHQIQLEQKLAAVAASPPPTLAKLPVRGKAVCFRRGRQPPLDSELPTPTSAFSADSATPVHAA